MKELCQYITGIEWYTTLWLSLLFRHQKMTTNERRFSMVRSYTSLLFIEAFNASFFCMGMVLFIHCQCICTCGSAKIVVPTQSDRISIVIAIQLS